MNSLVVVMLAMSLGQVSDANAKRAAREKAVARVGAAGRSFVEVYGEHAVAAIAACSAKDGRDLVKFFDNGQMDALPSPQNALYCIARGGNPVARFIIEHGDELKDEERFRAFYVDPMTFVMRLRTLDEGAAALRWRMEANRVRQELAENNKKLKGGLVLVGVVVIALVIWRRRRVQEF